MNLKKALLLILVLAVQTTVAWFGWRALQPPSPRPSTTPPIEKRCTQESACPGPMGCNTFDKTAPELLFECEDRLSSKPPDFEGALRTCREAIVLDSDNERAWAMYDRVMFEYRMHTHYLTAKELLDVGACGQAKAQPQGTKWPMKHEMPG